LILPAEGDLPVRPGRKFRIGDQTVCVVHVEAGSLQELSFSLRLDGNFASKDGVDHVSGIEILVSWVPILVVVFVFVTMPVLLPVFLGRIVLSSPLRVDAFEDTTFFHHVIGLGVELARSLQRLVVIFLVVSPPIGALDRINLVVVVMRAHAPEVIAIVTPPIPTFSMVAVVRATMVPVVETTTTVVPSRRLVRTSRILSDELFCVIGVGVVFCRGKELSHRGRPFAQ